jgi:O-antigen ligase
MRIGIVLFGLFLILLPFDYEYLKNYGDIHASLIALVFLCVCAFFHRSSEYGWRTTDLAVAVYLLYGLINTLWTDSSLHEVRLAEWLALALAYGLARSGWVDKQTILWLLVLNCLVQSVYALIQYFGVLETNHSAFRLTGSFRNPGPLGGLIALGVVLLITLKETARRHRWALYPVLSVVGLTLILSDSRAGWLSAVVALSVWGVSRLKKYRRAAIVLLAVLSIGLIAGLYCYRPESADSRLRIWKITGESIPEKPWTGHGPGTFPSRYMLLQADYFERHPDAPLAVAASDNSHAFNDLLRIAFEQGVIGLLLFGLILLSAFRSEKKETADRSARAGLLCWLIFSCFSYPSDVFPLKMVLTVLLGLLPGHKLTICRLRGRIWVIDAGVLIFILFFGLYGLRFHRQAGRLLDQKFREDDPAVEQALDSLYPRMRPYPAHVLQYARLLFLEGEYGCALPVLEDAARHVPSSRLYLDLGEVYQQTGRAAEAEKAYRTASFMVPGYLEPRYRLFRLYVAQGDTLRAVREGESLLRMPVKVENPAVEAMRRSVGEWLETAQPERRWDMKK